MQSNSPLLTIAVPTYNRARYLARLLDSLLPQLAGEHRVELLISDNASPDETQAILDEYRRRGLIFRGLRNQHNLGADGNIAQCFNEASGKYVWIVGDDDVLILGSLGVMLDLLEQGEYDIVHVSATSLVEGRTPPPHTGSLNVEIIRDAHTFALRTHVFLTFITGNIVNKHRVNALPHRPFSELVGTSLIQLGWTYTALAHFRNGALVRNPIIAAGAEDRGGYPLYQVFGSNLKQITETWLAHPALVRIVINGTLQIFFPGFVLRSRLRQGTFAKDQPEDLLHSLFSNNLRYKIFVHPLLVLPGKLARVWFLLIRIVNRINRALGNPTLR